MPSPTPGQLLIDELTTPGVEIVAKLASAVAIDPDDPLNLANITEASFAGYAGVPVTDWEDVSVDGENVFQALSATVNFQAADGLTPQNVVAVYVTAKPPDGAATLLQIEVFPVEFTFTFPGQALQRQVRVMRTVDE